MKRTIVFTIVLVALITVAFTSISADKTEAVSDNDRIEGSYEPIVVLELFTSQGCSSCPSADALLKRVKQEGNDRVFTLSYHVDYWNYIGWEDPFSKPRFAKKQGIYNHKFRNRSNYTPQLVVNGMEHFVGSNSSRMNAALKDYGKKKAANKISLSHINAEKRKVKLNYEVLGDTTDKMLRILLVLDERTTHIKRGENRNRTLTNSNIVVGEQFAELTDSSGSITMPVPDLVKPGEKLELIVLVESDTYDITAAAKSELKG
ncbi:DUF1223 domain-containing protein [Poritiphilus flavus]|uniref:DUF1223 domain-containing protein n=1 Tax=Poritiphilus flavus TaxID=2697053 RepID=A0A6L9ECC7_9FLAO|nr:DUF1223 domain-containing protein [Poritiphilus flavus]NAS12337.1 DUF1223 domain-containing protein [Poritiphilus flavus]